MQKSICKANNQYVICTYSRSYFLYKAHLKLWLYIACSFWNFTFVIIRYWRKVWSKSQSQKKPHRLAWCTDEWLFSCWAFNHYFTVNQAPAKYKNAVFSFPEQCGWIVHHKDTHSGLKWRAQSPVCLSFCPASNLTYSQLLATPTYRYILTPLSQLVMLSVILLVIYKV